MAYVARHEGDRVSRRAIYAVAAAAAIAVASIASGCTTGTTSTTGPTGSAGHPQATSTGLAQATSTSRPSGSTVAACSLFTRDQVGMEFGTPFGGGAASSTITPMTAVASSGCRFETETSDNDPWNFTVDVFTYATDAPAKSTMIDYRTTTNYTGAEVWAVTEQHGVGNDALFRNLLSLRDGQETLIVRKGNVIYWFIDTMINGIPDTAEARQHLLTLAINLLNR
jgi:hypothetical protein